MARERTAPVTRTRVAPVQGSTPEEDIFDCEIIKEPLRCYCCGKLPGRGLRLRAISGEKGLGICIKCDSFRTEEQVEKQVVVQTGRQRTAKPDHLEPEDAVCKICGRDIIDEKKIQRRIQKLTASGKIIDRDFSRIEAQERQRGWQYLSNNIYVHTRCKGGQ